MNRRGRADEVLVRRVFEEHGAALLAYASRLVGDRARGQAVAQEALVAAWRDPEVLVGPAPDISLLGAMETLAPEERDVLRALYFQGRDVAEAAESLGVPAGAVKTRSYQALRRLREAVAAG